MIEGWVEFIRIPCKEGFIDVWQGDCANNPNNSEKMGYNLNAFTSYFRLNGSGKWVKKHAFNYLERSDILELRDEKTAVEIWDEYKLF